MKQLHEDWVTHGLLDFEHKKYLLLGYLQATGKSFQEKKTYPALSRLLLHYQNLTKLQNGKDALRGQFPEQLTQLDLRHLRLKYQQVEQEDSTIQYLNDILQFAIPKVERMIGQGKDLFYEISQNLKIEPIGLTPMNVQEGYFFVNPYRQRDTFVYRYNTTLFQHADEKYRALSFTFLERLYSSFTQTYENMKLELLKRYKALPNPATFLLQATLPIPFQESLLPISKRMLMQHVAQHY